MRSWSDVAQLMDAHPQVLAVVQAGPEPRELKGFGLAGLKIIGMSEIPDVIRPAAAS